MDPAIVEALQTLHELDVNLVILLILLYLSIGFFFIEGTYEIIKNLLNKIFNIKPNIDIQIKEMEEERGANLERARGTDDEELRRTYEELAYQSLRDITQLIRKKSGNNSMNIIIPAILAIVYALFIYPYTIFTLLPFKPPYFWMEVVITGVLAYRGSNLAHGGGNKIGGLLEGLIGRVTTKFF